jgi:hypothetical protein
MWGKIMRNFYNFARHDFAAVFIRNRECQVEALSRKSNDRGYVYYFALTYTVPFPGILIRASESCAIKPPLPFASGQKQKVIQPNFVSIATV